MSKTKLAHDVVNDLRNLAGSIETLVLAIESNEPNAEVAAENKQSKENKKTKNSVKKVETPTLENVRAKLAALSQDGKQVQVKELITGFGANKLSDIPAEKYLELLEEAEKL